MIPIPAHDKLAHFFFGALAAAAGALLAWSADLPPVALPLAAAALVGAAKELRDRSGRGTVEFADFAWTLGGAAPVALAAALGA